MDGYMDMALFMFYLLYILCSEYNEIKAVQLCTTGNYGYAEYWHCCFV